MLLVLTCPQCDKLVDRDYQTVVNIVTESFRIFRGV